MLRAAPAMAMRRGRLRKELADLNKSLPDGITSIKCGDDDDSGKLTSGACIPWRRVYAVAQDISWQLFRDRMGRRMAGEASSLT